MSNPSRLYLLFLSTGLSSLFLFGCGERSNRAPGATGDSIATSATATTADSPSASRTASTTVTMPEGFEPFATRVFRDYASQGVAIPRSVTDSIAGLKDMKKMELAMNNYMRRHDSLVRSSIARHYGISLDSLEAIIRAMDSTRAPRED